MPRSLKKAIDSTNVPQEETTLSTENLPAGKAGEKNDYVEIRLPKFRLQNSSLSPLWIILLIIFAFLLGMTVTKLQYLEAQKNTPPTQTQAAAGTPGLPTVDNVKQWAKDIGLNTGNFNQCLDQKKHKDTIDKDIADAITAKAAATPTFYVNGHKLEGALPYSMMKKVIDFELAGGNWADPQALKNDTETSSFVDGDLQNGEFGTEAITIGTKDRPVLGNQNAKVQMVEFSDLECPYCKRFFDESFAQLKKEYMDTGKIAFYYRHLPLTSIHPMAETFANATECANDENKFWQMHDKIFKEQG